MARVEGVGGRLVRVEIRSLRSLMMLVPLRGKDLSPVRRFATL
jgi:hypothetical protein